MRIPSIALLALSLAAGDVLADRFYVGASIGASQFDGVADADSIEILNGSITEISIDGSPFDSTETAWNVHGGWQVIDWVAIEAGYWDLGNSGRQRPFAFLAPGPVGIVPPTALNFGQALSIEEWYLGARFSAPLTPDFSANWFVGAAHVQFESQGSLPVLFGLSPPITQFQNIPYASPDDEVGLLWGAGIDWKLSERVALGATYRQHNTQVLDIDTFVLTTTLFID